MSDKPGGILHRLGTPVDTDISTDISNVDSKIDGLNDISTGDVDTAISTGLSTYGTAKTTDVTTAHSTTDGLITTVDTVVDGIKTKTDNLPVNTATELDAIDSAIAGLNDFNPATETVDIGKVAGVAVTGVDDFKADVSGLATSLEVSAVETKVDTVDTVVDAIKVKTDNLPVNTATELDAIDSAISTVDTVVDAIKVKTDGLNFSSANVQARVADKGVLNDISTAQVNTEVDTALNTAIPGSPTANSVNERIATLDDNYTAARATKIDNLDRAITTLESNIRGADSDTLKTLSDQIDGIGGGGITAEQLGMLGGAGDDVPFYENWRGLVHQDSNLVAFGSLTNTEKLFMQTRYQNAPIWTYHITDGSKVEFDAATLSPYGSYLYLGYGTSSNQARLQALHPIFFTPTDYYQKSTIVVYECLFSIGYIHGTYCQPFIGLAAMDPRTPAVAVPANSPHVGFTIGSSGAGMRGSCYNYSGPSVTPNTAITTGSPVYRAKIVYTLGTDAKFYMNDTLVGTLTTYLPSSQTNPNKAMPFYPVISVYGSGALDTSWMKVHAIRYYRQNGA